VTLACPAGNNLQQIVDNTKQVAAMIVSITSAAKAAGAGAGQWAAGAGEGEGAPSAKSEQLVTMLGRFRLETDRSRTAPPEKIR